MATSTLAPVNGANGGGGDVAWTSASNITADDLNYAQVTLSAGQVSDWLIADAFGFAIPSGATIDGVVVSVKRYGMGTVVDSSVQISDDVGRTGDDKADPSSWPGMVANTDYGGPTDDWSAGLTWDEVNDPGFGVHIKATSVAGATALVGYVEITVYYSGGSDEDSPRIIQSATSRRPMLPRSTAILLDLGTEVVEAVSAWEPMIVAASVRRSDKPARSRAILTDEKLAAALTPPDTTPAQLPTIIVSMPRPRAARALQSWISLVIDAGSGEVCCCPGGSVVVASRFATATIVETEFATIVGSRATNYTASIVSDKFATAVMVAHVCDC